MCLEILLPGWTIFGVHLSCVGVTFLHTEKRVKLQTCWSVLCDGVRADTGSLLTWYVCEGVWQFIHCSLILQLMSSQLALIVRDICWHDVMGICLVIVIFMFIYRLNKMFLFSVICLLLLLLIGCDYHHLADVALCYVIPQIMLTAWLNTCAV